MIYPSSRKKVMRKIIKLNGFLLSLKKKCPKTKKKIPSAVKTYKIPKGLKSVISRMSYSSTWIP